MASGSVLDWRAAHLPAPFSTTFDGGDRRQCEPHARADAGRLRLLHADDFGARPWPYRRHPGQARFDPGYVAQPDLALFSAHVAEAGCAIIGQTAHLAPADKRLYAIRDVNGDGGIDRAHHRLDPVEETGGRIAGARDGRQDGLGAFMTNLTGARELAQSLASVATGAGLPTIRSSPT